MTSPITFPAHVIGLMSGTSADGVDAALLYTNGRDIAEGGASLFVPYGDQLRADILGLMRGEGDAEKIARTLTDVHVEAVRQLERETNIAAALVGFHGQTILHKPEAGITQQIGDADYLAQQTDIPVVFDFRTNDVQHGGQGAPLVPLFHAALSAELPKPLMVVNIGGVANVTWIGEAEGDILAFDCGPGNALLDDWMAEHTGARCDRDGATAAKGEVDQAIVQQFVQHPFFALPAPKSLDRNQFSRAAVKDLSCKDGAATLTAMTCAAIAQSLKQVKSQPKILLVTGGGRHNPTMMRLLAEAMVPFTSPEQPMHIAPVESVGWDGDMLEAQAFAYLAARSVLGLPLSLPTTTGVRQPVTGGVFYRL